MGRSGQEKSTIFLEHPVAKHADVFVDPQRSDENNGFQFSGHKARQAPRFQIQDNPYQQQSQLH